MIWIFIYWLVMKEIKFLCNFIKKRSEDCVCVWWYYLLYGCDIFECVFWYYFVVFVFWGLLWFIFKLLNMMKCMFLYVNLEVKFFFRVWSWYILKVEFDWNFIVCRMLCIVENVIYIYWFYYEISLILLNIKFY